MKNRTGLKSCFKLWTHFWTYIENLTNYKTYLHGEAVGIGMCMANALL